jgi:hypothetical protein
MILNRSVVAVLALFLGASGAAVVNAAGLPEGQRQETVQDRDPWDAPPRDWKEIQRRGFQDGIEGARKDFDNHRRLDVNNRDEYRHPSLPLNVREPYREGFRRGYERAMSHLMGDHGGQMRDHDTGFNEPERRDRDIASETQQRGFQDGRDGARKDFDNHRRPDVNNRDAYRHPDVPFELQRDYRDGFRRGYEKAVAEMTGGRGRPSQQM